MDEVDQTESTSLDAVIFELQKMGKKLQRQSTRDSLTGSDVTGCSDNDGNETPLSHAEESAIEECLNDTEGSLSNVDLNIFDDISDELPVHRTRKTRGQRTSERAIMDFGRSDTTVGRGKWEVVDYDNSSLDEEETCRRSSLPEISLNNPKTGKLNPRQVKKARQSTTHTARSISQENLKINIPSMSQWKCNKHLKKYIEINNKRIVRRKRRNSPPIRKNDRTHIHSFFSAMADLVSTFPDEHIVTAKQNVQLIMEDMMKKFKEWYDNDDPRNPQHGFEFDHSEYLSLQRKVAGLPFII